MVLTADEQERLVMLLVATAEVLGNEIKPTAALMMTEDLSGYPLRDLQAALAKCRREHTGKLTLKAVLDHMQGAGAWLGADEAWSLALKAMDEKATVVWTKEIAQAWGISRSVAAARDMYGARRAFVQAYERLVSEARSAGRTANWMVSDGWDVGGREAAIRQAVENGLLPAPAAALHLPPPAPAAIEVNEEGRDRIREGLRQLAATMAVAAQQNEKDRQEEHLQWRRELEERHQQRRAEVLRELEESERETQQKGRSEVGG